MVPTRRLWILVAAGIPVAVLAGFVGTWSIWIGYNAVLFLAAWASYVMAPSVKGLRLRRKFDPVLSVRVPNRILLELSNDGSAPVSGVFRDEPPPFFTATRKEFPMSVEPGREQEFKYELTPPVRGTDYFRGSYVRQLCPLGLVFRDSKLSTEQPIRVYPNVLALREFDLLNQKGKLRDMGIRVTRMRGAGTDFESLRDYAEGDDFRKIDWKASARRGKLIVRQYEVERNQPVFVCIDVGRRMLSESEGVAKLDHALDSLLMLLHAASHSGDLIGLMVYSNRVIRFIPPRKGRNQMGLILEAVHDLTADPVESDPTAAFAYLATRWKRRSLIVSFTDIENEHEAKVLAGSMASVRRHLNLIARVADPRLKELVEAELASSSDLYSKAAALMFTDERKRAGSVLDSFGVHSLEAEPQDLAAALVSFYFLVKEKQMI